MLFTIKKEKFSILRFGNCACSLQLVWRWYSLASFEKWRRLHFLFVNFLENGDVFKSLFECNLMIQNHAEKKERRKKSQKRGKIQESQAPEHLSAKENIFCCWCIHIYLCIKWGDVIFYFWVGKCARWRFGKFFMIFMQNFFSNKYSSKLKACINPQSSLSRVKFEHREEHTMCPGCKNMYPNDIEYAIFWRRKNEHPTRSLILQSFKDKTSEDSMLICVVKWIGCSISLSKYYMLIDGRVGNSHFLTFEVFTFWSSDGTFFWFSMFWTFKFQTIWHNLFFWKFADVFLKKDKITQYTFDKISNQH